MTDFVADATAGYALPAPQGLGGVRANVDERDKLDNGSKESNSTNSTNSTKADNKYAESQMDKGYVIRIRDSVGGRMKLAGLLDVTGSAVWRFENGKMHSDETDIVDKMAELDERIKAGEFADQAKGSKKDKADNKVASRLAFVLEGLVELDSLIKRIERINKSKSVAPLLVEAAKLVVDLRAER
jgi:hypothetical protein